MVMGQLSTQVNLRHSCVGDRSWHHGGTSQNVRITRATMACTHGGPHYFKICSRKLGRALQACATLKLNRLSWSNNFAYSYEPCKSSLIPRSGIRDFSQVPCSKVCWHASPQMPRHRCLSQLECWPKAHCAWLAVLMSDEAL